MTFGVDHRAAGADTSSRTDTRQTAALQRAPLLTSNLMAREFYHIFLSAQDTFPIILHFDTL